MSTGDVYAADLAFTYDPNVVTITTVSKGDLIPGWSMAANTTTPGVVRIAIAGATPVQTSGELLKLSFRATGSTGESSPLTLTQGDLNEGAIPADLDDGLIEIAYPVHANFTATPTGGVGPLTVAFTNASTGDYTSLLWAFGDGGTSILTDPSHVYTAPGNLHRHPHGPGAGWHRRA